jgi:hypothetical protein
VKPTLVAAAVGAGLLVALLGWALARSRAETEDGYARERAAQRRAVAASRPVAPPVAPAGPVVGKRACVSGLDTFAVAVERQLLPLPDGRGRRLATLRAISDFALRAERVAELARPAPTLPRRMGLENGQPVAAEKRACDGGGFAEIRGYEK